MPIVWITGLPNAGKTVVADEVATRLRVSGKSTVRLDGDLMRLVFGWSELHTDQERRRLAVRYVHVAEAFAAQGHIVVVSVVGIFPETFRALMESSEDSLALFLEVADAELARRDTRGIYAAPKLAELRRSTEDLPPTVQRISNDGRRVEESAEEILGILERHGLLSVPTGRAFDTYGQIREHVRSSTHRRSYWDGYYSRDGVSPQSESSFAQYVGTRLSGSSNLRILDFGCGDGRDTFYLAQFGTVVGVDTSASAIDRCTRYAQQHGIDNAAFSAIGEDGVGRVVEDLKPQVVYSRFVLHAMTEEEQAAFLRALSESLRWESKLFIECRAIDDSLERQGVKVSARENVVGHYRRFIDPELLQEALLDEEWSIDHFEVGRGLAKHPSGDPRVIRIEASRQGGVRQATRASD